MEVAWEDEDASWNPKRIFHLASSPCAKCPLVIVEVPETVRTIIERSVATELNLGLGQRPLSGFGQTLVAPLALIFSLDTHFEDLNPLPWWLGPFGGV